jgi:hypothetical protein
MTQLFLPVQLGTYANDGTGDDLRTAFQRVNNSFSALLVAAPVENATNIGPVATAINNVGQVFSGKNNLNLEFKSLTSTGNSVAISNYSSTVNIEAITTVQKDASPTLGGNLNLNGHTVTNGNILANVYGYDLNILASQVALMFQAFTASNAVGLNIEFGNGFSASTPTIDMGSISPATNSNDLNFGTF